MPECDYCHRLMHVGLKSEWTDERGETYCPDSPTWWHEVLGRNRF